MGYRRRRGAPLTAALAGTPLGEALAMIAEVMKAVRDPWWVIGSAAVALHGGATVVGDVDVLLSVDDARAVAARLDIVAEPGGEHPLFRSALFFVWYAPPLAVEFMAGFAVADRGEWRTVAPCTRQRVTSGSATLFVPDRDEVRALLARIGRPKDLARLDLL